MKIIQGSLFISIFISTMFDCLKIFYLEKLHLATGVYNTCTCNETANESSLKKVDFNVSDKIYEDSHDHIWAAYNGTHVDNICFVTKQMQQTPRKICPRSI